MKLFDTPLEPPRLRRDSDDFAEVRRIAESGNDHPVLMLNMNRYTPDSGFSDRGACHRPGTVPGGRWRQAAVAVSRPRQAVGDQKIDEILACWYPFHRNFLELYEAPGAAENFRRKGVCVEYAVIHRCPGDRSPFAP